MDRETRTYRCKQQSKVLFQKDTCTIDQPIKCENIFLLQLGDLCGEPGFAVDEHRQFCHELLLICQGEVLMTLDDQEIKLGEGSVLLLRYGTRHKMEYTGTKPGRVMYLGFMFHEDANRKYIELVDSAPYQIAKDACGMRALFELSMREYENHANMHIEALSSIFQLLIICAYRSFERVVIKTYKSTPPYQEVENDLICRVAKYIHDNDLSIDNLKSLAERFNYSYSHISHLFSQYTDTTLRAYLERCRFEHALELMKEPDMTITKIASLLNYQSIHSFSRAFRQIYGISPSKYQRILRSM